MVVEDTSILDANHQLGEQRHRDVRWATLLLGRQAEVE
jgi:hypothetical protein